MNKPVLKVTGLTKIYKGKKRGDDVIAAKDVSFTLHRGEVIGLVGESGSGKTTIGRLVTGIEKPTSGTIEYFDKEGQLIQTNHRRRTKQDLQRVQMVFQDPYSALNPFNTIAYSLTRPLINFQHMSRREAYAKARELLETVQLTPADDFLVKRPDQLSGGQRQRVVVARALAADPDVIVADEPTSMLDVSIRTDVLKLLDKLRQEQDVAFIYITHDLLSTHVLANQLIVLYHGEVMETGDAREVIQSPQHSYTQLLLRSIPNPWREHPRDEADGAARQDEQASVETSANASAEVNTEVSAGAKVEANDGANLGANAEANVPLDM